MLEPLPEAPLDPVEAPLRAGAPLPQAHPKSGPPRKQTRAPAMRIDDLRSKSMGHRPQRNDLERGERSSHTRFLAIYEDRGQRGQAAIRPRQCPDCALCKMTYSRLPALTPDIARTLHPSAPLVREREATERHRQRHILFPTSVPVGYYSLLGAVAPPLSRRAEPGCSVGAERCTPGRVAPPVRRRRR